MSEGERIRLTTNRPSLRKSVTLCSRLSTFSRAGRTLPFSTPVYPPRDYHRQVYYYYCYSGELLLPL